VGGTGCPRLLLVAACAAALFAGCAGQGESVLDPPDAGSPDALAPDAGAPDAGAPDGFSSCNPPALTYANFGMPFFGRYCASCHAFDQSVAQLSGSALSSLVTSGAMPRGATVPTLERMEFAAWIACGAP
jgi:hypothetical protein